MSTFINEAIHPRTGKTQLAVFVDDFYGPHEYGVAFRKDGTDAELMDDIKTDRYEIFKRAEVEKLAPKEEKKKSPDPAKKLKRKSGPIAWVALGILVIGLIAYVFTNPFLSQEISQGVRQLAPRQTSSSRSSSTATSNSGFAGQSNYGQIPIGGGDTVSINPLEAWFYVIAGSIILTALFSFISMFILASISTHLRDINDRLK